MSILRAIDWEIRKCMKLIIHEIILLVTNVMMVNKAGAISVAHVATAYNKPYIRMIGNKVK